MANVLLTNMNENKLEKLIEKAIKNNKIDSGEKIYVCKVTDVSPEEILSVTEIVIINGIIYTYGPKETRVHRFATDIFINMIFNKIKSDINDDWMLGSGLIPITAIYQCGSAYYKRSDAIIRNLENDNYAPLTIETAFTHESFIDMLYELINLISEYTTCTYSIGIKIDSICESFKMEIIILKRSTPVDQRKIDSLNYHLRLDHHKPLLCIKNKVITTIDDINSKNFNSEVVYHKIIDDSNINEPIEFILDGEAFHRPEKALKIIISSKILNKIKKIWEEYKHEKSANY